MHLMTYFNRTDAQLHDYWKTAYVIFLVDMILQLIRIYILLLTLTAVATPIGLLASPENFAHTFCIYVLLLYLCLKTMWNQVNMRNVWALAISQYIVSIVDRVVQITLVLSDSQSQGDRLTILFLYTSYIRACCTFMVFFALPAIVLERCFATFFLEDYEKKQRPYLGHTITTMMLLNALMCSYTFHEANSTYFHIGCVLVVNTVAIAVNKFNIDTNKRYYYESMQSNRSNVTRIYSLGERYQIAQNIKVCKFVFHSVIWIGLLNVISALCLVVLNFHISTYHRNVTVIIFNFSLLAYGITIAIVMCWHNDGFKAELRELSRRLCSAPRTHPEFVSVVSTMGYETHVHQRQHAACYFDMLKKDWS